MASITDKINRLEKEKADKSAEIFKPQKILEVYPDAEVYTGRWNKVVYCSPSVNELVTNYDSRHNCGCCSDSPLEIWPYLNTEYGRIYSKPAMFFVGERSYRGDNPFPGWEDKLRNVKIPESIIDQIRVHFTEEEEDFDE